MTALAGQGGAVPLFATPFAAVNTDADQRFNERLASLCESQRSVSGVDFLDSADATAIELRRLMLGHASAVVASVSNSGAADFAKLHIQARGWCSIVPQNGHLPAQHFPGASWLAVYCAQAGETEAGLKSAGVLRLYERRLGSMFRDASTEELKAPYRYGNHTWTPVPGWMALFPAHVPHEVSVVRAVTPLILVFAMIRFVEANAKDGLKG
jgi:hypothetical protein